MRFSQLVLRNSVRSPVRTLMTVVTVAILLAAFVFPRTLVEAQERQVRESPNNRVLTQPRTGWGELLPARYGDEIRANPGIRQATGARFAGLGLELKPDMFFGSFAMDPVPFIAMHHELVAPREQKEAWLADDQSMIVSQDLARELGWKLGERVVFKRRGARGDWAYTVKCIYEAVGGEWAKRSLWIHYGAFNRTLSPEERDKLNFVSAEIFEPNQGGRIARELDRHFDAAPVPTITLEDRVQTAANIGRFRALLSALDFVSYLILLVVLSILANTLAMNVRERQREFAVLRALGFGSRQLALLVAGEALLLGLAGTLLGLLLSYPLIEGMLGPLLQEALQFPPVEIPRRVALTAVLAGTLLAMLAAVLPALRLSRREVAASFGRVT
jgi:putative ABC transport system permease protein